MIPLSRLLSYYHTNSICTGVVLFLMYTDWKTTLRFANGTSKYVNALSFFILHCSAFMCLFDRIDVGDRHEWNRFLKNRWQKCRLVDRSDLMLTEVTFWLTEVYFAWQKCRYFGGWWQKCRFLTFLVTEVSFSQRKSLSSRVCEWATNFFWEKRYGTFGSSHQKCHRIRPCQGRMCHVFHRKMQQNS